MSLDRTFTFEDGTAVELLPLPPLVVEFVMNNQAGKPKPPMIEVERRGHRRHEPNPDDPDYLARLAGWNQAKQHALMKCFIDRGVKGAPSEDEYDTYAGYLPDGADEADIKYMWIADKLTTVAEVERFIDAVVSQTVPTEEGIAEAEAVFPSDGQWQSDPSALDESTRRLNQVESEL